MNRTVNEAKREGGRRIPAHTNRNALDEFTRAVDPLGEPLRWIAAPQNGSTSIGVGDTIGPITSFEETNGASVTAPIVLACAEFDGRPNGF